MVDADAISEDLGAGNPVARAMEGTDRIAVVHHWDADGIASAALVIEEARRVVPEADVTNMSPTIGRWLLNPEEISRLRAFGPDLLVLVDLAVRDDDLEAILDGVDAPVLMVDHHRAEVPDDPRVEYYNPVAKGAPEEENPSCTWVLRRLLGRPDDLLAVLGVFGDRGRGVIDEPVWPHLEAFLETSGLEELDMHLMVDLVDSSAKRTDREAVEQAVRILVDGWRDPRGLLETPEWAAGNHEVERALTEQMDDGAERVVGSTLVKDIDTPYLVISTAARRLIRHRDFPVVVVINRGYADREVQVYVRRLGGLDLSPLIGRLRQRGLSAGGKSEVLGAIVPTDEVDEVVEGVLSFISSWMEDEDNDR
jgi:single-stranded DNA-specific DHH superfamily exonuclease